LVGLQQTSAVDFLVRRAKVGQNGFQVEGTQTRRLLNSSTSRVLGSRYAAALPTRVEESNNDGTATSISTARFRLLFLPVKSDIGA